MDLKIASRVIISERSMVIGCSDSDRRPVRSNDQVVGQPNKRYICSVQSKNRYNSRIVLRKVGILTLLRNVGILTLRNTILELLLRKVRIGTKWESHFISFIYCTK